MDLYEQKGKSIPQKMLIIFFEIILLIVSYKMLFSHGESSLLGKIGVLKNSNACYQSKLMVFVFSVIVFLRTTYQMIFLVKRKIPWEESFTVPIAFALYFIGFPLFVLKREIPIDWFDYLAVLIFIIGSYLNTVSEIQRDIWKKKPENKGKLYTIGLFRYSMHINYFGDILWVSAYAMVTRNYYSIIIPVFLFFFFVLWNIPMLDTYLAKKYTTQFDEYKARTKRIIPFVY